MAITTTTEQRVQSRDDMATYHRRRQARRAVAFPRRGRGGRLSGAAAAVVLALSLGLIAAAAAATSGGGRTASAFILIPANVAPPTTMTTRTLLPATPILLPRRSSATTLSMIGGLNLGGSGDSKKDATEPTLPRDVKDAVTACRTAVQAALGQRLSRMDVEFPVGTKFGVEKDASSSGSKKGGGRLSKAMDEDDGEGAGGVTREQLIKSDRELARLFVDMFQPVGGENIAVVFNDLSLANEANKRWKDDASAKCRVTGINRSKVKATVKGGGSSVGGMGGMGGGLWSKKKKSGGGGSARSKKRGGFAAKMAEEMDGDASGPFTLPPNCEVALFVTPGPKELIAIERICDEAGMGTLVVLLNARLDKFEKFVTPKAEKLFKEEFEAVFHLGAAPQQESAPGCLIHRAYPDQWMVARKPKVGPPKTIGVFGDRPGGEECAEAYANVEIGDVEGAVEGVLENVAGWFK